MSLPESEARSEPTRSRWLLPLCLAVAACGGGSPVVRVYDGRIVEGGFVPPTAYAAYLKGVLAEEAGDLRSALAAYEEAVREDDEDPEPLTRAGELRCRVDPKDAKAEESFARALAIDAAYAPALAARARCAAARGEVAQGIAIAEKIGAADRATPSVEALFVRLAARRPDSAADAQARRRAVALTLASGERVVAWDALVTWGRAKFDGELLARGLEGVLRVAPARSREVEAGALELLGAGLATLARRVAAAVADATPERGVHVVHDPTVARLAIDDALLQGDVERAERRATRGHVSRAEVAARALVLEKDEIAIAIAGAVAAADPSSRCASMVLAAARRPPRGAKGSAEPADRPAAACVLALASRMAILGDTEAARTWVERVAAAPMAPHDPLVGPLAVDLAARGVLAEASLPRELRLELAARRREAPPPIDAANDLDARHVLLWHTLVDPTGAPARTMLARLHAAAERDPIVGFALARVLLASPPPSSEAWASVRRAIAAQPLHPLLLAAAVEVAKRAGRAEDAAPARVRLLAVAQTPAERALARE